MTLPFLDYSTKVALYSWDAVANDWAALPIVPRYSGLHIAGAATTVVKSGAGTLHLLSINKAVLSSVITIYDNTAASGTILAIITNPAVLLATQATIPFDVAFSIGLTIVTSAADDLTVAYR